MLVLCLLGAIVWGLLLTWYFTGDKHYRDWAYRVFAVTIAIAFSPMILFVMFEVRKKISR